MLEILPKMMAFYFMVVNTPISFGFGLSFTAFQGFMWFVMIGLLIWFVKGLLK